MNVEPIFGVFLNGVPALPMTVTKKIGVRLVRTGAFSEGGDGGEVPDGIDFGPPLDHYDPPDAADTEGPADAGPSDSQEG